MERKKCQICDGSIVNGRCKLCGMPYRNDEVLYHLNENRRDHYRHAGKQAREIMRRNELPQGQAAKDWTAKAKPGKNRTVPTSGKHAKKAAFPINPTEPGRVVGAAGNTGRLAIILILIVLLGYNFYTVRKEKIRETGSVAVEPYETEAVAEEWTYVAAEGWSQEAGKDLPEGSYIFYSPAGSASIQIAGGNARRSVSIQEGELQELALKEGDIVTIKDMQYPDQELWIREQ